MRTVTSAIGTAAIVLLALALTPVSAAAFTVSSANPNEAQTASYFATDEPLLPTDTDTATDIYRRAGGALSLETLGSPACQPSCGNGGFGVITPFNLIFTFGNDGLFIETAENLVPTDTDSSVDVYQRSGGTTTLVSQGQINGNGAFDATVVGWSLDGSRVLFTTAEKLVPEDTDESIDLYERAGGTTTLVSQGQINGNGAFDVEYVDASAGLASVIFTTAEKLVPEDTDESIDLYERSGGTTRLVSRGPNGFNGPFDVEAIAFVSSNSEHVLFETAEPLVAEDTDTSADIYERSGGTTTLVSQGPGNFNTTNNVLTFFLPTADFSHVFFTTADQLVAADTDSSIDIYERSGGTTTLVSQGPNGFNGASFPVLRRISPDGSRVFFTTGEKLVAEDTDSSADIYERAGGTTTLVSQGPNGFNGAFTPTLRQVSPDGKRAIFTTKEQLVAADTDSSEDIYERSGGTTTLVSQGQINGNGAFDAKYGGGLDRLLFTTAEQLVPGDTDAETDVYERSGGRTRLISTAKLDPPAPSFAESNPPSGSNANSPTIRGSAEAESTVALFTAPGCTGAPILEGTAAEFATPGLTVSVPDDSSTSYYANATDANDNTGPCTPAPFTYVEDSTALPPSLTGTIPPSPANDNGPRVRGSAERGSVVQLFTNSLCLGAPAAIGPTAELEGAGIAVPVPDNFTTTVFGKITDAAGNTSACSPGGVSYTEDSQAPETEITGGARGRTHDTTPTIRFSANEPATFRCAVDGKAAKPCVSPFTTRRLKPGRHRIAVTATDLAGNVDQTPAVRALKVLGKHRKSAH